MSLKSIISNSPLDNVSPSALGFLRKMRGGAQAHLCEASDGYFYVVKFRNNPQRLRSIVNDWIVSGIMRHLGISTPTVKAIRISDEFLSANPDVYLEYGDRRVPVPPGLHFGSRYVGDPRETPVYDCLPLPYLRQTGNLDDFVGALVVDKWTANSDSRQAIFTRNGRSSFTAHMIDHGLAFFGHEWRFWEVPRYGLYRDPVVYETVTGWKRIEPWVERVAEFPSQVIQRIFSELPREWIAHESGEELDLLVKTLLARRRRVGRLLQTILDASVTLFPNWNTDLVAA